MKKLIAFLALCAFAGSAWAEPFKLTNRQAHELLGAMLTIEDGLTAVNTGIVADNITELTPKDSAYLKGEQAAEKRHGIIPGISKLDDKGFPAYQAEADENSDREITVELTRFEVSNDEIAALRVKQGFSKPEVLSILRRYLRLVPPKKSP